MNLIALLRARVDLAADVRRLNARLRDVAEENRRLFGTAVRAQMRADRFESDLRDTQAGDRLTFEVDAYRRFFDGAEL